MAVGNAENLQHALQRAVLARPTVQHIERDVGLDRAQHVGNVASDIDAGDAIAKPAQGLGRCLAGAQRDFALRRPTPIKNGNVLGHGPLNCAPRRYA
jgi:hypothetical protein